MGETVTASADQPGDEGPEVAALRADLRLAERALAEKRPEEADRIAREILDRHPGQPHAVIVRGFAAAALQETERAIGLLEAGTRRHGEPAALALLANLHRRRFDLDVALRHATAAVARAAGPARVEPLLELARVHIDRDESERAAETFLAVLALDPEHPGAHLGLGQVLLARGDFAAGFREYAWRNRLPEAQGRIPPIRGAAWNGMPLERGRLLIICDQGFGDVFQFARFIPEASRRVRELVVACSPDMEKLLARIPGVARCCHAWAEVPGFSACALVSDLPGLFEVRAETIPAPIPYLEADPARAAHWRARLADEASGRRRIGLFWSGRPTHPNNARRSLELGRLRPILDAAPDALFVSVQKERSDADAARLAAWGVLDLAADLRDFEETSAVLRSLDLLVTIDSGVAHLAGALGRPVAMLVPSPADWRWQRHRNDSPWYPTMRLHRQPAPGDWDAAIADLARSLAADPGA